MIPEMPDDWWPDLLVVRGSLEHEGQRLELSFGVLPEEMRIEPVLKMKLNELRFAMWQAKHIGPT